MTFGLLPSARLSGCAVKPIQTDLSVETSLNKHQITEKGTPGLSTHDPECLTGESFDNIHLKTQSNLNAAGMIENRRQLYIHAMQLFALAP